MNPNPILSEAIGSIIRKGLIFLSAYLVQAGIWTDSAAERYVEAAVVAIISIGWGLWQKYVSRTKLLVALGMPADSTEAQVVAEIATGAPTPSVTTMPDQIPTQK